MEIKSFKEADLKSKKVLLRLDINSPIDPKTKKIINTNRINKSLPTLEYLISQGSKVAIIAHQGDTLDYQNLIPLEEHAKSLSELLKRDVKYIDDVCGPAAVKMVNELEDGDLCILGNLRYLSEEISTFETVVKLTPEQMRNTWLIRTLAPLFDLYINDAFAAAHRASPSMVGFQSILPSYAGELFFKELSALTKIMEDPHHPSVFVLGGAKISDAFGMMEQVLSKGTADMVLTSGVTGIIMMLADGIEIGEKYFKFLKDKNYLKFVEPAKDYLSSFPGKIEYPSDLAVEIDGVRHEIHVSEAKNLDEAYLDIGEETIGKYREILLKAETIFVNGPAGVYENTLFENGTKGIWQAVSESNGYSVIGGGDTVTAAKKYIDLDSISYVCTAGGAMVQFMSGDKLPLISAMENSK